MPPGSRLSDYNITCSPAQPACVSQRLGDRSVRRDRQAGTVAERGCISGKIPSTRGRTENCQAATFRGWPAVPLHPRQVRRVWLVGWDTRYRSSLPAACWVFLKSRNSPLAAVSMGRCYRGCHAATAVLTVGSYFGAPARAHCIVPDHLKGTALIIAARITESLTSGFSS